MSPSRRRAIFWFIAVLSLVVVVVVGGGIVLLALREYWAVTSVMNSATGLLEKPAPVYDAPTPLASISVPHGALSLTWSADGAYLAAGAWGWGSTDKKPSPSEVYVVDLAAPSVAATLQVTGVPQGLSFSPDGKWLAVATTESSYATAPAVLVVFDVPAFTAKLTAKAKAPKDGFLDLAWAADSKALYAIDGERSKGKSEVRGWSVPAFTEQPPIVASETITYTAIAVAPDGRTAAVADDKSLIRLLDLGQGTEVSSFQMGAPFYAVPRLAFTPDGKALGIFGVGPEPDTLSWWDVVTGKPAKPDSARFVAQPAGVDAIGARRAAVSTDGRWRALGSERHRGFGDLGWDNRDNEFGAFVRVTNNATAETWTWRVGETKGSTSEPALAFSPDGRRLAGTVVRPGGQRGGGLDSWIMIWPVPK